MLRPQHFILLASLLMDGGTVAPQSVPPAPDAGAVETPANSPRPHVGTTGAPASPPKPDAGTPARKPVIIDGFRWPEDEELRLLTLLDGRAIVAAHAALQEQRARFAKEDKRYVGSCEAAPKAMDLTIFEGQGLYVVRIDRRLDRCNWAHPSFNKLFPSEFYAVSPEGRVLARYPYNH